MTTIRKASLRDVPELSEIWEEYLKFIEALQKRNTKTKQLVLERKKNLKEISSKYIRKKIRSKDSVIYIAEIRNEIAGACMVWTRKAEDIFKVKRTGHLADIYVKNDYRGKGIASAMNKEALKWLKKRKIKYVSLNVFSGNDCAHKVYRKWGFRDFDIEMWKRL
jgi:ribosomal protein S18 acetylase RimI-like enzyme